MVRRLTACAIAVAFVPAVAQAQVVIDSLDKPSEESTEASGDSTAPADGDGGTNSSPPARFEIERLDEGTASAAQTAESEEDAENEKDAESETAEEEGPPPIELEVARELVTTAFRNQLTECLAQTPRPREHRMAGSTQVTVGDASVATVRTSRFAYNTDIHLTEELLTAPTNDRARKKTIADGKKAMSDCLAQSTVDLGGPSPVPTLSFAWNAVWFNEAALLRDIEWLKVDVD